MTPKQVGLVVHPSRDLDEPLHALRTWAKRHHVSVGQVPVEGRQRQDVAETVAPADCDLIAAIGGDGTTLAAIRSASEADRPVLGIACGSLGALTSTPAQAVGDALERFSDGDWTPLRLPALSVTPDRGDELLALNDLAVVRSGVGQLRSTATLDGSLLVRLAGDGCIVSTAVGSSAYALAARGPLIAPGTEAFVFTPLPFHGGFCPPVVLSAKARLELEFVAGHGGARIELDGQVVGQWFARLTVVLRPAMATVVTFEDQEPFLAGLRRRGIIMDSPRILAEDARS